VELVVGLAGVSELTVLLLVKLSLKKVVCARAASGVQTSMASIPDRFILVFIVFVTDWLGA
jgi:hypothetical protein